MSTDSEKEAVTIKYITGFASLADAIASDVDHSTVVYKRFDRLAARNLLYMQSELSELEEELDAYDREDKENADRIPGLRKAASSWKAFEKGADTPNNDNGYLEKRMKLALKVREKLKDYREALLFESGLLSLRSPSKQTHNAFYRKFWNHDMGGDPLPTLRDASENLYNNKSELVALNRSKEDRLTVFLRNYMAFLFRRKSQKSSRSWVYFSAKHISIVVTITTILLAATFLFGAIYNLYWVTNDNVKLGLITAYTVAFAVAIALITDARRSELFGACAAYAAVLVVFVSGDLGGSKTSS